MKVKIDEKLICIPPHISATWDQVTYLHSEESPEDQLITLTLHLSDGRVVKIPGLDSSLVDIAFAAHMQHLEANAPQKQSAQPNTIGGLLQQLTGISPDQISEMPIRFGISGNIPGMENIETAFQHVQEQADAPDMPDELLEKVAGMAKMMLGGDLSQFPKPEPHCNCPHCQLARSIHGLPKEEAMEEEVVSDEELTFRTWDVEESAEKMFVVTNPLDTHEQYTVYLGRPIGCTCGQADCEHIKAVLYS